MPLSIKVNNPELVLAEGEHLGFQWAVVNNGMGARCGYVRVTKGHPWHGKHYDDIRNADGSWIDVHGGLTFGEPDTDDGHWFGFDCLHYSDAQDPDLPSKIKLHALREKPGQIIRTQEYVENECRKLCEQALAATQPEPSPHVFIKGVDSKM